MAWEWLQSFGEYTFAYNNDEIPTNLTPIEWTGIDHTGNNPLAHDTTSEGATYRWDITDDYYLTHWGKRENNGSIFEAYDNNVLQASNRAYVQQVHYVDCAVWINHELGYAIPVNVTKAFYDGSWYASFFSPLWQPNNYDNINKSIRFYEVISTPPITYQWQSVPSISGKNGILQSLVQIKESAINDGEPVSEASVTSFDSLGNVNIPSVIDEQMPEDPSDVTSVTATYLIPALEDGTYEGIKLLVKKNSIPTSEEDADKVIDLSEPTSILRIDSKSVGNLDEDSHYYFMIKLVDEIGTEATSEPKDIWTSHSEGYNFDYTGEIVEWTVPKTGIYSLETWGAQGGEATDGTNSARGGYGAYAYGEVLLQQGETIYINVGGQNGYGGGGNYDYNDYMIVQPDANGYILDAHAASDGFYDRISGRKMKVIDGNFDNFTYDSTNDWITFGQGCDSLFGFYTKIPEDLIMSISAIDFELEGKWTQSCTSSALKFLGRITLQSDREAYAGTMDCVFVRGGHGDAPALTLTRQNNGSPYWQTVFDSPSVIYDGVYDHWKNLEEVITYHMDLSNGVVTYSSQHCTQGVGAGTRIRANDSDYNNIILNSGDYLKIVCGSLQGFNARAYRIKVTTT